MRLVLLDELAFAANYDFLKDQMYVLFQREVIEAQVYVTRVEADCEQIMNRIRQRSDYIKELKMLKSCVLALDSIRHMKDILVEELEIKIRFR